MNAMKTRDRILDVSLTLFNEEGEASLTAVDIANALDMSPGNLYYHFKGKEPIIDALFDRFEAEMKIILNAKPGTLITIEDYWVFTYIILEEIYDFRFFYRNLGELTARFPSLGVRFRGVLAMKRASILRLLRGLERRRVLSLDRRLKPHLVDQLVSTLTFWLSLDQVEGTEHSGPRLIHDTVLQFMLHLVPHMGDTGAEALSSMLERHQEFTSGSALVR